jgi:hypothetical protein
MTKARRIRWAEHVARMEEDIGGKARKKESTGKRKS